MITGRSFLIVFAIISMLVSYAQEVPDTLHKNPSMIDLRLVKSGLADARDIVIAPVRWNQAQWAIAFGVTGLTIGLVTQDLVIQQFAQRNRTAFLDAVSKYVLEPWGSGLYTIPAMGIMYGISFALHDKKARMTALKGVEAFVYAAIAAQILKQITHRQRPIQGDTPDPYYWEGPIGPITLTSFPSGHSAAVFAVATVIASAYEKTVWVPVLCYSLASLTALSRIYDNEHWMSDVVMGTAIGLAIGQTVFRNSVRLKLLPTSPTGPGLTLVYRL
ncbi:MAG: phosphatase PAP2 family protein [Bacteroidetes bacterium]|nr:phosphatase PAP2 family protein [Bacteroidota bacterium]